MKRVTVALLVFVFVHSPALAQKRAVAIDDIMDLKTVGDPTWCQGPLAGVVG